MNINLHRVCTFFALLLACFCIDSFAAPVAALTAGAEGDTVEVDILGSSTQSVELVYRMPAPELRTVMIEGEERTRVIMGNAERRVLIGEPVLPVVPCRIAIPSGYEVDNVEVAPSDPRYLPGQHSVEQGLQPYPLLPNVRPEATPLNTAVYSSDQDYPAQVYELGDPQRKRGVKMAFVNIFPVRYVPAAGSLYWYEELRVIVSFRPVAATTTSARRVKYREGAAEAAARMVDNPATLATYKSIEDISAAADPAPLAGGGEALADGDWPALPCDPAESYEYLVVTSAEFRDDTEGEYNLQKLLEVKETFGLTCTIVSMEDINAEGSYTGADDAETLRNFIIDAYNNWGVEYVLLGGDINVVPLRKLWCESWPGGEVDELPSDVYYQCLDGSYNENGNDRWGEPDDGVGGGDVDLESELAIGRASAETKEEMSNWVYKVLKYGSSPESEEYLHNALMLGEHLGFGGVSEYAKAAMEEIRLGSSKHGYTTAGFADSDFFTTVDTLYDADLAPGSWSRQDLIDRIESNKYSIINHLGHCNFNYWARLINPDADNLSNTNHIFVYSQGCIPGAFDRDCIAEHLTTSTTNGMFSVVMNSRFGWGSGNSTDGPSQRYNRPFWDAYFGDMKEPHLGLMNAHAHEYNIYRINESCMRWVFYESNLLGDPHTMIAGLLPQPSLTLDRLAYRSDAVVGITLFDAGIPDGTDEVPYTISTTDPADTLRWKETNDLVRVGETFDFTNSVQLVSGVTSVEGDTLTVECRDSYSNELQVAVLIDDTPPVITNVSVYGESEDSAFVEWYTDEPADSFVVYSETVPLAGKDAQGSTAFSTEEVDIDGVIWYLHTIEMTGLEQFTAYRIAVRSSDYAGNTSTYPDDLTSTDPEDYVLLVTPGRFDLYSNDMDDGALDWTAGSATSEPCWEYGAPSYRPGSPYTGERCWGTVLDGRYPSNINAWVESGVIQGVELDPRIEFWSWHEIVPTESEDEGYQWDYGQVEINVGDGWRNVTQHAQVVGEPYLRGASDWQLVTVDLAGVVSNADMRIRFRLESDNWTQGAGWFIDDVKVSHRLEESLVVFLGQSIDDSDGGDGDGYAEPGETFNLNLQLFNSSSTVTYSNASSVVSIADEHAELLSDGNVSYGDIAPGQTVYSGDQIRIKLSAEAQPGDIIELFHSLFADGGVEQDQVVNIPVEDRESVFGSVVDQSDQAIASAYVWAENEDGDLLEAVTEPSGSYRLNGFLAGEHYDLWAGKYDEYSPSDPVDVVAPAASKKIVLGKAYADPSPDSVVAALQQSERQTVTIDLDNSAGNIEYHADLEFAADDTQDDAWLSFDSDTVSVAAGTTGSFDLHLNAGTLLPGEYSGVVKLIGNDISGFDVEIPVELTVTAGAILTLDSVEVIDPDGDGYLEPGESVSLEVSLENSGAEDSGGVGGTIASTSAFVNVTSGTIVWSGIDPGEVKTSFIDPTLDADASLPDGTVVPFTLEISNAYGEWSFDFAVTSSVRYTVSGNVSASGTGVAGAEIEIVSAADGGVFRATTDGSGDYSRTGLLPGDYEVTCIPPAPYKMPPSQDVDLDSDKTVDFAVADWGIDVAPDEFVETVDEGRELERTLTISNSGSSDGQVRLRVKLKRGLAPQSTALDEYPAVDWASLDIDDYKPGRLIVGYEQGATANDKQRVLGAAALNEVKSLPSVNASVVEFFSALPIDQVAAEIASDPAVKYVEPDYIVSLMRKPDDPLYGEMYALNNIRQTGGSKGADIRAEQAWDITVGDTNVVVAVVDSGCDLTHEDLIANYVPGGNFTGDSFGNIDVEGHGTHVAGTIAAVGDNGIGVSGVSWNSKIMPCRIFGGDDSTNTVTSAAIEALAYAVENGVRVSNHSWGGLYFSAALRDAIQHANTNGMVMVCAAGNSGWDNDLRPHYPSSYDLPNIISVAATDHNDLLATFSCYGAESVDIAAPGVDILSTYPEAIRPGAPAPLVGQYVEMSGTSMASPQVSGVVALLLAKAPWATVDMIKAAVLEGSRHDPDLEGVVSSAGHLDAYGALQVLATPWLQFDPDGGVVPAGGDLDITVTLNAGGNLPAGVYEADIEIIQGINSITVPVELSVLPAPVPELEKVSVENGDGDGYAEPGETFDLDLSIANDGALRLPAFVGTLSSSTPGVTINGATANWGSIASGEEGSGSFSITLAPTVGASASFTLEIDDGEHDPWTMSFSVDVENLASISGTVRSGAGSGVADARVEYLGSAGGAVATDAAGAYRIDGLPPAGTYKLRVITDAYATSDLEQVVLAGSDAVQDFNLLQPEVDFQSDSVEMALQWPLSGEQDLFVTNSSPDLFEFSLFEMPHRKVALICDGEELDGVADYLRGMGMDVTVYSNNYEITYAPYLGNQGLAYLIEPVTHYSSDDAVLLPNDLVILSLSGVGGEGRLLGEDEIDAFDEYMQRGGCLLVNGGNPLSSPDNTELAELFGIENADRAQSVTGQSSAENPPAGAEYIEFDVGDKLAVEPDYYDLAEPTNGNSTVFFKAGDASKILKSETDDGGRLYYWSGNGGGAEWGSRNVWLDVLRKIVLDEMAADVEWLDAFPAKTELQSESAPISLQFNDSGDAEVGEYQAGLLLVGNYPGAEDRLIEVSLQIVDPTVVVKSTSGVTDWMGRPLSGDGGSDSAMYQLVWAGLDGEVSPPNSEGKPSGDDMLLDQYPSGARYSYFGKGYPLQPDEGLFKDRFSHELHPTTINRKVYVRAWDAPTPAVSVAYGDSDLYEIQNLAFETNDFASWTVDSVLDYPGYGAKDSNGDSVPDGYYIGKGLDPRLPIEALEQSAEATGEFGEYGTTDGKLWEPRRVALAGQFLFVLDTRNNRIQVWNRVSGALLQTYQPGTLAQPYGMGIDPRAGVKRLAVADKNNHRISVFSFDAATAALSFDFSFGSYGAGNGQLNNPRAVAIDSEGDIFVADTGNRRIQKFDADGAYISKFGTGLDSWPEGICVDGDGLVYVADSGYDRVSVYAGSGSMLGSFDGSGGDAGAFSNPTDVQLGQNDSIFVADKTSNQVQMFLRDGLAFDFLFAFGESGSEPGQFQNPYGIMPADDEYLVYVADTYNNRVQEILLTLDSDGDGIDDQWELDNGLDPTDPADALLDSDRDGLLNIGESRLDFDPQNRDMDGDGQGDGSELWTGNDPLDPEWDRLRITRKLLDAGGMHVYFVTESGGRYAVEVSSDLLLDDWQEVPGSEFVAPSNGVHIYTAPLGAEEFFRPIEK